MRQRIKRNLTCQDEGLRDTYWITRTTVEEHNAAVDAREALIKSVHEQIEHDVTCVETVLADFEEFMKSCTKDLGLNEFPLPESFSQTCINSLSVVYRKGIGVRVRVLRKDRLDSLIGCQTKQGMSMDSIIPQNVVCSQELRAFFAEHLGKGFHFKAEFQDWLHDNAGKVFREAVEAYHSIEHPKEIKPQFEYNQYVRDFFADNKGATLKDAIRCWHWKKLQPGSHRYAKSDLDAVKE